MTRYEELILESDFNNLIAIKNPSRQQKSWYWCKSKKLKKMAENLTLAEACELVEEN